MFYLIYFFILLLLLCSIFLQRYEGHLFCTFRGGKKDFPQQKVAEVNQKTNQHKEDCRYKDKCNWLVHMKNYIYTHDGLNHFRRFIHPTEKCKHGKGCYAFVRLGNKGDRLDDLCHAQIYTHKS